MHLHSHKSDHNYDWNALNEDAVNFEKSPQQLNKKILKDVRRQKTSIVLMHSSQNKVIPFCSHTEYTVLYFLHNDYCCHPEIGKYMALHLLDLINISVVS